MPAVRTRVKLRKLINLVLKKPKSETSSETQECAQTYHTDNSYTDNSSSDDDWSYDEGNDDWSSVRWHNVWEQICDNSASSLSLRSFDLCAMSSRERLQWVKMNLARNEDTLRTIGELARKKTARSSSHRTQPLQLLFEHRSEANRNQCCERFSAAGRRAWQSIALISST